LETSSQLEEYKKMLRRMVSDGRWKVEAEFPEFGKWREENEFN
jgi:hypothetical protein